MLQNRHLKHSYIPFFGTDSHSNINHRQKIFKFKEQTNTPDDRDISIYEIDAAISMKFWKVRGIDSLKLEFIKTFHQCHIGLLSIIYNLCLKYAIFPSEWKIATIIPIYKGNGKDEALLLSYRPTCLLPVFGKFSIRSLLQGSIIG